MAKKDVKVGFGVGKPKVFLETTGKVDDKIISLGEENPLKAYNTADFHDKLENAKTLYAEAEILRAQSESKMQQAKTAMGFAVGQTSETPGTLYYYMTLFRDQLLLTYRGNEEELSVWGFEVVVSGTTPHPGEGGGEEEEEV